MTGVTVTPLATFRNESPYPFCPGCGHGPILDRLNEALVELQLDARRVVIVSDIGCAGLSDQYFATSAFHGLHGRSLTYASGIKLARPELEVIVVMGDGGTGIGGAHLLNAARRNIGLTLLVFNNFNYGMTGGQHSATTPPGALTATTPTGNLERPLDLCATAAANGASYAFRGTSFDADLAERIAEGVRAPGFAVLDVWELCTAYFVPNNRASRKTLGSLLDQLGFATGVIGRSDRPEYTAAYRRAHEPRSGEPEEVAALTARFESHLDRRFDLVVAGSAGERVRSATRCLARAAVLSGLWAAQRDDYPVTVKTGHSLSQLSVAPDEISYAGASRPDAVLVLSEPGRRKVARTVERLEAEQTLFTLPDVAEMESQARPFVLDPGRVSGRVPRTELSLLAVAAVADRLGLVSRGAFEEAVRHGPKKTWAAGLAAVAAGFELGGAERGAG